MASTAGRRRPCWRRTGLCHRRTGLRITETEIGKTRAETCAPTSPAWRSLGEFSRPETLAYLSKSRKYREFSQTWRTTAPRPHWLAGAPGFEPRNGGIKPAVPHKHWNNAVQWINLSPRSVGHHRDRPCRPNRSSRLLDIAGLGSPCQSVCGGPSSSLSLAVSTAMRLSASVRVRFGLNASSRSRH